MECTFGYLRKHPGAAVVMTPLLKWVEEHTEEIMSNVRLIPEEIAEQQSLENFYRIADNRILKEIFHFMGLPKEMEDAIEHALCQIPNK